MTALLTFLLLMQVSQKGTLGTTVLFSDGRPNVTLESVELNGITYLPLSKVASALGGSFSWLSARRRAAMVVGEDSVSVTIDSPFFSLNGRGLHLRDPVLYRSGIVLVPETLVELVTEKSFSLNADWTDSTAELHVRGEECDIHVIDFRQDSVATILELSLPMQTTWHMSPIRGDSAVLTFAGALLCTDEIDSLSPAAPVRSLTGRPILGGAKLVFRLRESGLVVNGEQPGGGGIIVLTVTYQDQVPPDSSASFSAKRIVIDPGHGGKDSGVISSDGLKEKEITLSLALLVSELIKKRMDDVEVFLTREDDSTMPLPRRTEFSNNLGADLLVSLHCNSSFNRSSKGFQAFFLSPSITDAARAVAATENAVLSLDSSGSSESNREGEFLLWDIQRNKWLDLSKKLATTLTTAASKRLDTRMLDVAQAALLVLNGATMPSVLLEIGYLSNPVEARKLHDSGYIEQVALAIVEGLESFISETSIPRDHVYYSP